MDLDRTVAEVVDMQCVPSDRWTNPDADLCEHVQRVVYQLVYIDNTRAVVSTLGGEEVEVLFHPRINLGMVTCVRLCRWAHRNRGFRGRAHELRLLSGNVMGDKHELVISIGMEPPTEWFLPRTAPPVFIGTDEEIRQARLRWWRSSLWWSTEPQSMPMSRRGLEFIGPSYLGPSFPGRWTAEPSAMYLFGASRRQTSYRRDGNRWITW